VRDNMALSRWNEYTDEERIRIASCSIHAWDVMPPKYLWMHHDAKLSSAELDALKEWAHH